MSDSLWPCGLNSPWNSSGQNTGVGSLSLLRGIFPTQRMNPGFLHRRWNLYQLSHKGSPRTSEWVAHPFFSGSAQPRDQTGSPALQADALPVELPGKPCLQNKTHLKNSFLSAIPLLGIYTEETRSERDTCTPMFIAALFLIARIWKQARCPSADEWIRNLWYIYTMESYSAIKKNAFVSVLMRWMKLEPIT